MAKYNKEGQDIHEGEKTEHEIFVLDKSVVWSSGGRIRKSFTLHTSVKQAVWCRFDKKKYPVK